MDTFTASNGITVSISGGDYVNFSTSKVSWRYSVSPKSVDALHEYFRAQDDQRHGRWRWPENPDYVVYLTNEETVSVLRESDAVAMMCTRGRVQSHSNPHADAARAYFEAHPSAKAWQNARNGEAWVITWRGGEFAAVCDGAYFVWPFGIQQPIDDADITAGYRVYPSEVSS